MLYASVIQRIELWFPKPSIQVRFLSEVLNTKLPYSVMVAQQILVLFAQVRTLVGQQNNYDK